VQATGFFYYDVWDPAEGLSGGHVTLQNMTLTDIFCSYTDRQARRAVQVDRGFAVGGFSGK
jgi:hypothetical protein